MFWTALIDLVRFPVESQKGKTCPMKSLAFRHVDLRPGIQWERKSANPLPIRASADMQCPIELDCWRIESSVP